MAWQRCSGVKVSGGPSKLDKRDIGQSMGVELTNDSESTSGFASKEVGGSFQLKRAAYAGKPLLHLAHVFLYSKD